VARLVGVPRSGPAIPADLAAWTFSAVLAAWTFSADLAAWDVLNRLSLTIDAAPSGRGTD
jgi:hypothetical protein